VNSKSVDPEELTRISPTRVWRSCTDAALLARALGEAGRALAIVVARLG
jgi:hypothetical protein